MHSMNWKKARRAAAIKRETLKRWRRAMILATLSFLGAPMQPDDPLLAELAALRAEVEGLRDKVASLERENITLSENQLIQLRLIGQIREAARKEPQPLQKDRADILKIVQN